MIVVLDFFLGMVDITSVRVFAYNFGFILLFETTGLVFIFVSVVLCPRLLTSCRSC